MIGICLRRVIANDRSNDLALCKRWTIMNGDNTDCVVRIFDHHRTESAAFREELEALRAKLNLTVVHVLANPPPDWTGERGHINAEVFKCHLPPPYAEHEYFICGPDVMMDAIETVLGDLGVPMTKYHSERYSFV